MGVLFREELRNGQNIEEWRLGQNIERNGEWGKI